MNVTEHPACGGGTVTVLGLARCPGCAHRQAVDGIPPRQTRSRPWRFAAELLGRRLAKRAARDDVRDIPDPPVAWWPRYYTRPAGKAVQP